MRIILASRSPRRNELLKFVVPKFEVIASKIEEILEDELTPEEQVCNLSYQKAKKVFDEIEGDKIVIGSDTIVVKDGKIYGKPKSKTKAKMMLKELTSGNKVHQIITGLCVLIQKNGKYQEYKEFDKVDVYLKEMTDKEIEKWISIGKAVDRAGAYGIQDEFSIFIDKIDGNYTTAVGLPVQRLYDILKEQAV